MPMKPMNLLRHILSVSTVVLLVSCGMSSTTSTVFHLRIEGGSVRTDDELKILIKFHTPPRGEIIVETEGSRSSLVFDVENPNGTEESGVLLTAKRVAAPSDDVVGFQTELQIQTPNGGLSGGPSTHFVPPETKLSDHLDVTIDEGEYPLNTPVKIGTFNGNPILLTVRTGLPDPQ